MSEIAERQETLPAANPMDAIMRLASSGQAVDMEVMRGMMDMRREMQAEQAKRDFAEAMNRAQQSIPPIKKDAFNTQTQSRYAKWETINATVTPHLTAQGLSLSFGTGIATAESWTRYTCTVRHVGGHEEVYEIELPPDDVGIKGNRNKTPMHAAGSSTSYGMRYLVGMIFSLAYFEDDDGVAASANAQKNIVEQHENLLRYIERVREHFPLIAALKEAVGADDAETVARLVREQRELDEENGLDTEATLRSVWRAPRYGGIWETHEREYIKQAKE